MNSRTLQPTTIVPDELYVERAADRQLRSVINQMGRPGYILVARQMGKTNLLLHMKRERKEDIVLYLDLSNRFDSANAWFRNVIDGLVDIAPEEFSSAYEQIIEQRLKNNLSHSSEYDRHLRALLKATQRKVIIILDEIDSLVNTSYSDIILSQIRSMYFSRANYPEYSRLTYVLSGVAEPTDLIKDKNISPFNIGEKIYLNNFGRSEFDEFLRKAHLVIQKDVADRLYDWTSGNPRMTWDICAELEMIQENGQELSSEFIDAVVRKMYFQEFDRAPIDHIRTLVETDNQIRDAIVSLRYGKGEFLDLKIKSKLHLAGITSTPGGDNIEIANKIVDVALSDEWLESIASSKPNALATARESFAIGEYLHAIKEFEAVRLDRSGEDALTSSDKLALGLSYLNIGQRSEAIVELGLALKARTDLAVTQEAAFYLAVAYVADGKFKDAVDLLDSAAVGPIENICQHAMLEKINALLKIGSAQYTLAALDISKEVISRLRADDLSASATKERLKSALYARATVHLAMKRRSLAKQDIDEIIHIDESIVAPVVLLCKHDLAENSAEKRATAAQLYQSVIERKCKIRAVHDLKSFLTNFDFGRILLILVENGLDNEFIELVEYYCSLFEAEKLKPFTAILKIYDAHTSDEEFRPYLAVLSKAIELYGRSAKIGELQKVLRAIAINKHEIYALPHIEEYISHLRAHVNEEPSIFTLEDATAFAYIGMFLQRNKTLRVVRDYLSTWNAYKERFGNIYPIWRVYLDAFQMDFLKTTGATREAQAIASTIVKATEDTQLEGTMQGIDIGLVMHARKSAARILNKRVAASVPIRELETDPYRGIGRNQRVVVEYKDGIRIEKKFKTVEHDLRNGLCQLVVGENR